MSNKQGAANGNWKGGISKFRSADDLLTMPAFVQLEVKKRLLENTLRSPGCWNWKGPFFDNGRAKLVLGTNFLAYRLAYVIYKGSTEGLCVLHSCDNVKCVNPAHLWLGTNADNSADMVKKGRAASGDRNGARKYPERLPRGADNYTAQHPETVQGENNGMAQLTEKQAREIKKLYRPYVNCRRPSNASELAKRYGVSKNVILLLGKGQTWRHL